MPAGGALFGSSATGPGSTRGFKHIVEVRAGKMNLKGRMVYPDKRKGLLYTYQSDDSLMHLCWQDRTTGVVEDDLIIFPDECEIVKVPQCTTGRVYLLKFKLSTRRFFFWLQEPRSDKDEETCKRINDCLNNPSGSVPSGGSADQDLQSLLNNMSQSQLMQLFGSGVGQMSGLSNLLGTISRPSTGSARTTTPAITHRAVPTTPTTTAAVSATPAPSVVSTATPASSTTTPQTTAAPAAAPGAPSKPARPQSQASSDAVPIQLADLRNFLQGISPPATESQSVDLSTALTGDALTNVLSTSEALEQLQTHLPAVGAGSPAESLRSTLASPQFQQAVSQFSSALESGQLAPVVSQLAVSPEAVAAASQGNMQEFVKALEKSSNCGAEGVSKDFPESDSSKGKEKEPIPKNKSESKKKEEEEEMQLD